MKKIEAHGSIAYFSVHRFLCVCVCKITLRIYTRINADFSLAAQSCFTCVWPN